MKREYATAEELLDDYQREATECARERLDVLADTEDVLTAAYYSDCEPGVGFMECRKCDLLSRTMWQIAQEQEELRTALVASVATS
jgi:hypothetical protein